MVDQVFSFATRNEGCLQLPIKSLHHAVGEGMVGGGANVSGTDDAG